ncbi:hypothetical protein [Aeromicrobium sp. UC242_57]|uniref:hypothetical protein n=1 Tax=Aeromicrobium sp. UC242_57 TaxID=3374624 RepID=UPI0037B2FAE6
MTITEVAAVATAANDDAEAAVAKSVPPLFGLAILAALGAVGAFSLVWHVVTGRRRRERNARLVPSAAVGVS